MNNNELKQIYDRLISERVTINDNDVVTIADIQCLFAEIQEFGL